MSSVDLTEMTWDLGSWKELSPSQRQAAQVFGWGEATWDCPTFWDGGPAWEDLTEEQYQAAVELDFDGDSWADEVLGQQQQVQAKAATDARRGGGGEGAAAAAATTGNDPFMCQPVVAATPATSAAGRVGAYLLLSQPDAQGAVHSYVGATTDFARRLREHNGQLEGGAQYTTCPHRFATGPTLCWRPGCPCPRVTKKLELPGWHCPQTQFTGLLFGRGGGEYPAPGSRNGHGCPCHGTWEMRARWVTEMCPEQELARGKKRKKGQRTAAFKSALSCEAHLKIWAEMERPPVEVGGVLYYLRVIIIMYVTIGTLDWLRFTYVPRYRYWFL
jgi:hypothetical protein